MLIIKLNKWAKFILKQYKILDKFMLTHPNLSFSAPEVAQFPS